MNKAKTEKKELRWWGFSRKAENYEKVFDIFQWNSEVGCKWDQWRKIVNIFAHLFLGKLVPLVTLWITFSALGKEDHHPFTKLNYLSAVSQFSLIHIELFFVGHL